jgi:two-component system, OmpR family, response regulator CpxR
MPVLNILCGSYCGGEEVIRDVAEKTGYQFIDDSFLIAETSSRFQVDESKIRKALSGKASIFNRFTYEKERCLAYLKRVLADLLKRDDFIYAGLAGLMIPRNISHVLSICLIADMKYRTEVACRQDRVSEKDAPRRIHKEDESLVLLADQIFRTKDPWAAELYDIVIPLNKLTHDEALRMISDTLKSCILTASEDSMRVVEDFILAAEVNLKLTSAGHSVSVSASDSVVLIEINKHVLMLSTLEDELKKIASSVPGVVSVETKVGPGYYQSDVYRKFDFDVPLPSKVLLVDDEREFVETLSERLQMRDFGSAVVYGGEEALSIVEEDEPEVMVLDLKMPGIDGLEVLKQVKEKHPNVEVIVLTGHGSKDIADLCLELGACAYLEKPVDIDKLTRAMEEAYKKVRTSKGKSS